MKKIIKELSGFAYDFSVNGIYFGKNSDGKTVYVTYKDSNYNSYSGSVVIPSTVTYSGTTYSVTSIGRQAFSYCSGLTSVTIPNSVTSIGIYAFKDCSGLTSVSIPNSVTSIGSSAFQYCSGLTKVEITDIAAWCKISFGDYYANPLFWAQHLYQNGKEITNLVIPNSVTSIGQCAFADCIGLTSVTIPNSVTSIGIYAFRDCSRLTSVTIPNSVTSIGGFAFNNCSGLTSVTIPNSVTSIGRDAFSGTAWCNNQPDGLVYAGKVAYNYKGTMPNNASITIKDGTLGIAGGAFKNCSGLTSVTIPNSVTSIGSQAFLGCSGLTSVTIGNSVTSIGRFAFSRCSGLTSVTIPNSVTSIGKWAFSDCSGLTSVTIPNSVTSIGGGAFDGTAWYDNQPDGLVYAGKVAYKYKGTMPDNTSITIKDGTLGIAGSAFSGCSGLTSVTIPNSVTSIGSSAFYGCSKILSFTSQNATPPTLPSESVFEGVPRSCPLYVPASSKVAYQRAVGWIFFTSINAIGEGDIETIDSDSVSVTAAGGAIRVEVAEGAEAEVYSPSGELLYRGTDSTIALPRGVYIVKVAGTTTKVIL